MNINNENMEQELLEAKRQKEEADKWLLKMEIVIGIIITISFVALIIAASLIEMEEWARSLLIFIGFVPFIIGIYYAIKIEQIAGYYECQKCHHKYVPKFSSVFWAMHMCRTRYMRCPECNEKSWQKKVLKK